MLHCFDFFRHMDLLAITSRLVLALICGGVIGLERETKRRPAGFRTHILICMGSAITILSNQYLYQVMHLFTDISRMGAQVIAGISFVGAGTIIVTRHQKIKGLTTAAGLWTASIIGLACGAGYAECAIFATLMVLLAELLLIRLENRLVERTSDVNIYIEYTQPTTIQRIVRILRMVKVPMNDIEVNRIADGEGGYRYGAILTVRVSGDTMEKEIFQGLSEINDVQTVEEL
ncbi:MAG: MgtC/SapB family protein [Oscillospiraceae bacterium]|nr:MgtC/SapB family protein [Oscillospiraceae bacterium]